MNYVVFRKRLATGNVSAIKEANDLIYSSIMSALAVDKKRVVNFASKYIYTIDINDSNDSIARAIRSFLKRHKPFGRDFVNFMQNFRSLSINKATKKRNANGSYTWEQSSLGTNVESLFTLLGNNASNWSNVLQANDQKDLVSTPKRLIRTIDGDSVLFAGSLLALTYLIIKNKRK